MHAESSPGPSQLETLERSLEIYKGLVEVSALINSITDLNALLPAILDVAGRTLKAESSALLLVDSEGNLRLINALGPAGEAISGAVIVPRGKGIAGWVLGNRQPLLVPDAYADPRFYREVDQKTGYHTRSILSVPLITPEREIGVLQVLNPLDKPAFEPSDLEMLVAFGNLAATAIEKLRIIERRQEQAQIERDLSLAREIQTSFLPLHLPELPGLRFSAAYQPALNVGGDFYDVIQVGPDEIYFVVGDVSGKGIPAALMMAQAISTLRQIVRAGASPSETLARWNRILCGHTIRGMFITAILGRIIPSIQTIELSNAGHCLPFLLGTGGNVTDVTVASAPPLGILDGASYESTSLRIEQGDWLVFFTDGFIESFDSGDVPLGRERAAALLGGKFAAPADVVTACTDGESRHRQEAERHDDITLLVFGFP